MRNSCRLLDMCLEIATRQQKHAMTDVGGQKLGGGMGEGELGLGATISGRSTIIAQLLQVQQRPVIQSVNQVSSQWSSPLLTQAPSASHVLGESRTPRTLCGNEAQNC